MSENGNRDKVDAYWWPTETEDGLRVGRFLLPHGTADLTAILYAFRWARAPEDLEPIFWNFTHICGWYDKGLFEKNPWSERTIYHLCRHRKLGIGGAASSSKSHTVAGWGIANWLCDPAGTLVLVTSTTKTAAKRRIGKSLNILLRAIPDIPGSIRADGTVPYVDPVTGTVFDGAGIHVIAGSKENVKAGASDLIGTKALPEKVGLYSRPRLFVLGDEFTDLSQQLLFDISNLDSQEPQVAALANPSDLLNPFGKFCEPVNGWDSVDELEDDGWETKNGGYFIRFDGHKSPNVGTPQGQPDPYPYITTRAFIASAKRDHGEGSAAYNRFIRAMFQKGSRANGLMTRPELLHAMDSPTVPHVVAKLAALDPNRGGTDKCPLMFATLGMLGSGRMVLRVDKTFEIYAVEDSPDQWELQIAKQVVDLLVKENIPSLWNLAIDSNSNGAALATLIELQWKERGMAQDSVHRINTNAAATEVPCLDDLKKTCREVYGNLPTQLWHEVKHLATTRQIFGLPEAAVDQFCSRQLKNTGRKIALVTKEDFKKVYGRSPDEADDVTYLWDLARNRFGMRAMPKPDPQKEVREMAWDAGSFGPPSPGVVTDIFGQTDHAWLPGW